MSKKAFKVDNSIVLRPNSEPVDPQNGELYFDEDTSKLNIRSNNSWLSIDPVKLSFSVNQPNNFIIHDAVYWNGSSWVLARANNESTLATHIVNSISSSDTDRFELCSIGRMDYGAGFDVGKSVGHYYFLSDKYGANFIIKDNPLSVQISINGIPYTISGTTVSDKLTNLVSTINSAGYTATGYTDVVAIESTSSISISSADNEIISVSASSTRLGFATPIKPNFGYDNLLFFIPSKDSIIYNCYRPIALGGVSASAVDNLGAISSNVLYAQDFEDTKLTDFTQTGLLLTSTSPLRGATSALLVHQSSIDQSFKQSILVDRAFRGRRMKFKALIQSTAYDGALKLTLTNETTSTAILTNEPIQHTSITVSGLSVTSGSNTISGFLLPEPVNNLQIGCRVSGSDIPPNTFIIGKNTGTLTATMSNNATASNSAITLEFSDLPTTSEIFFTLPYSCETLSYTITASIDTNYTESHTDDIVIELAELEDLQTQVDIPNLSNWQPYIPSLEGFGTATDIDFKWRQVGENIEILGNFVSGNPTVDEARIPLPNSFITAGAPILTNITVVGSCSDSSAQIAVEPSVGYLFFIDYSSNSSLTRQSGDTIVSNGQAFSFFASIPCTGLEATYTSNIDAKEMEDQIEISETDVDFSLGKMLSKSISANTAFSFSNSQNGQTRMLVITNTSASDITVTFPAGKWAGAAPVTICFASSTTILTVVVANGQYYYATASNLK